MPLKHRRFKFTTALIASCVPIAKCKVISASHISYPLISYTGHAVAMYEIEKYMFGVAAIAPTAVIVVALALQ